MISITTQVQTDLRQLTALPARNEFLDFLKGVLILLVTYGHAIQFGGSAEDRHWDDPVFRAIYLFHMPLFMAVSGYVTMASLRRRTTAEVVVLRFRQLLVPVAAWAVLWQLTGQAMHPEWSLWQFPRRVVGYMVYSLWFLWALFGSTVVLAVLYRFRLDKPLPAALTTFLVLCLPEPGNFYLFKYALPFFLLGYFVAKHSNGGVAAFPKWSTGNAFLVCMLVLSAECYTHWTQSCYVYLSGMEFTEANLYNIIMRDLAGVAASAAVLSVAWRIHQVWRLGWVATLGKNTLAIYIVQGCLFSSLEAVNHPWRNTLTYTLGVAPFIALLISVFCAAVGRYADRLPTIAALLFGKVGRRAS